MKNTMINSDAMVACIKAFLDPLVMDDGEFRLIIGRSREACQHVSATWPVEGVPNKEQLRLVRQATGQLLGYPHKQDEYIEKAYGVSHDQIRLLDFYWMGWRDGANPNEAHELRGTHPALYLFGEFPSGPKKSPPKTPLFMWVDTDIAEYFKEGVRKESYRRMHDALREFVDANRKDAQK